MKKLLLTILFTLVLSGGALSLNISELNKLNKDQINSAIKGKKLSGFYLIQKTRFFETYFENNKYEFNHEGKLSNGKWIIQGSKICIKYDHAVKSECADLYHRVNNGVDYYYYVNNQNIFAGAAIIGEAVQVNNINNDTVLKCESREGIVASLVINESSKKIIFDGLKVNTKINWGTKVKFKHPDPNKYNKKLSNDEDVILDRVSGELTFPLSSSDFDHLFQKTFICKKTTALF